MSENLKAKVLAAIAVAAVLFVGPLVTLTARAQLPGTVAPNVMRVMVLTLISGGTGSVISDSLGSGWATNTAGGATGAFSAGNLTSQTEANSSACNAHGACPAGTAYLGKKWLFPRVIQQVDYWGPNNNSLLYGGGATGTASFDGSNDGSCAASWVSLDSFVTSGANSQHVTRTSANINTSTAYLCHRISTTQGGAVGSAIAAFQMQDYQ